MKPNLLVSRYKATCLLSLFICVLMSVGSPRSSQAAFMPGVEPLAPLAAHLTAPTNITVDHDGKIYVAESSNNQVVIYSQSGSYIHTISGLAKPISLAVDVDGRILVGNLERGNVEVYNASFEYLFNLGAGSDGQGTDEFEHPNDVDVGPSGLIYVVDKGNSVIRVYNPDGTYNSTIGQSGNGDGQLHHPLSLTFDTVTSELVVLDQQLRLDTFTNTMIDGVRLQFLELDGTFKRGYEMFGYDMASGELVAPVHVAVDELSRVFVSDARIQKIMVYENNSYFLGMIDNPESPLRTPLGLAIGKTNKLYVASLLAGQVEIYGLDGYIGLAVRPAALNFEELEGEPSGKTQELVIQNTGNRDLSWTMGASDSWITLSAIQGVVPASGLSVVGIGVDLNGLEPGRYNGTVTISAEDMATEIVTVSLIVLPAAEFSVSPLFLTFNSTVGTTPLGQILSIENAADGTLDWNATAAQSWLTMNSTSGTAPSELNVYADITALPAGSYSGTITLSIQGDTDTSEMMIIPVSLTLTDPSETPDDPPLVVDSADSARDKKWTTSQVLPGTSLNAVWGSANTNLFVVGTGGAILHYDGMTWSEMASGVPVGLFGVWGSSAEDVYAVGDNGLILHYAGNSWSSPQLVGRETLSDVWGSSPSDIYMTGGNGSIVESFAIATSTGTALHGIWGSSESNIFVVGDNGIIFHNNGSGWTYMDSGTIQWLNGIWGSSESDIFAVGKNGTIIHYNGTSWSSMDSGTTESLQSVWGSSATDVFAVGGNGLILHFNGSDWQPVATEASVDLYGVWVSEQSEVFAVGENGTVVYGRAGFSWMLFYPVLLHAGSGTTQDQ